MCITYKTTEYKSDLNWQICQIDLLVCALAKIKIIFLTFCEVICFFEINELLKPYEKSTQSLLSHGNW